MRRGLSLYLDLLRFGMAATVWIGHSTFHGFTGTPFIFWFAFPYMQTAVMGFFVLSGFVIAYVVDTKERAPSTYTIARLSRLYSIVIPALIVTFACDTIGQSLDAHSYHLDPEEGPIAIPDSQPLRYLASFFMIQNFWVFPGGLLPGTNGPFWSLSYEIVYYVIFGLLLTRNWIFILFGLLAIAALAGPGIILLFPLWLLGVGTYHLNKRKRLPWPLALPLLAITFYLLAKVGWFRADQDYADAHRLQLDYAEGFLIAVNILAASALAGFFETTLSWCASFVGWLGRLTFAVYLCHYPLLIFFSVVRIGAPGTPQQQLWLFGGCLLVMAFVTWFGDHARYALRRWLTALTRRFQRSYGTGVA